LSTGLDVREVKLYMSAMEAICIAGLMIGILILHLMSKYAGLMMHATWNNQRTQLRKFDHPKCANGKYWSRIRYSQRKSIKYQAEHLTARRWLHQSGECVKAVISGLQMLLAPLNLIVRCISGMCKMLLAPLKLIGRCISALGSMLLAPLKLVGRCISGLCKMLLAPLKPIGRCISALGSMLLAPLKLVGRCISGLSKMLLAPLKLIGRCISGLYNMLLAPLKLIGRCIWRSKADTPEAELDTQTAHADSQHCNPKGGNSNDVNEQGLQAHQAHGTTGLYMERQVRKFCQVHALNAMLGRNAIQLETMLKFCEEHAKDNTALGQNLRRGIGWCSKDGNFADMMIDAFLHFHSVPSTRLYQVAQNIPVGSDADMYLRGLPADQNAFVLRWHCGNMPHEDSAYGHAVCVKRHPISKKWYLLDSEKRQPIRLDDAGWHSLKGTVCIFAKGSAYNHNTLPGAAAEGYTQWLDVLDFITPGEVGITTRATTGPRPARQANKRPQCIRLDRERPVTSDQQSKQKVQEHDSDMPKILKPASDESKLPYEAQQQQRPRRIACGKRLFRMETAERPSDLHPKTRRATEAGTAVINTNQETTATDHLAEHASDAQLQKRRRTNPLPDYIPHTRMWPIGPETVSQKPAVKRQTSKRTKKAEAQNCDVHNRRKKRQAVNEDGSNGSHETKQPAKVCTKIKGTQQTGTKDIRSFFVFGQGREAHKATDTGQMAQCTPKRHKAQGEPAKEMPSLRGLCWNVRGLTTVLHELTHLVEQHAPDFVILTETKLRKKSRYRKKLTEALEDYAVHTSCKRDTPDMREGERTGAAGVAIAIHKKLAAHGSLKVTPLNAPAASGHCQKICLEPAGSDAIDLWAVYMPHDMAVRRQVYQVLTNNATENSNFIMAGVWNAAYLARDRCTGELQRPADEEHAQLLQALQMQPTDQGRREDDSRHHTFYAEGQQQQHSRIDDFTWS